MVPRALCDEFEALGSTIGRLRDLIRPDGRFAHHAPAANDGARLFEAAHDAGAQSFERAPEPTPPGLVLIIDRPCHHRSRLAMDLKAAGFATLEADPLDVKSFAADVTPTIVVTELTFDRDHREGQILFGWIRAQYVRTPIVVVSDGLSIASTVWAMRHGATSVLPKPVHVEFLLESLGLDGHEAQHNLRAVPSFTLRRATWEYVCQVMHDCPSLAGAARRLGIQPRSLRRMLAKTAPPR